MLRDIRIVCIKNIYKISIFYFLSLAVYLFFLDSLNKNIQNLTDNPFKLLGYNGCQPLWFLLGACILWISAIFLVFSIIMNLYDINKYIEDTSDAKEFLKVIFASLVLIILFLISCYLVWEYINNPILRIALLTVGGGSALAYALSNDN